MGYSGFATQWLTQNFPQNGNTWKFRAISTKDHNPMQLKWNCTFETGSSQSVPQSKYLSDSLPSHQTTIALADPGSNFYKFPCGFQ